MALWHIMMSKDHCHRIKIAVESMSLQAMRLSSSRALTSATSACAMLVCMSWEEQVSKKLPHDQFVLNKAEEQYFASFRSSTSVFIKKWHHNTSHTPWHVASSGIITFGCSRFAPRRISGKALIAAASPGAKACAPSWAKNVGCKLGRHAGLACLDHANSSRSCRPCRPCRQCQCGPRRQSLTSQLVSSQTPGKHRQRWGDFRTETRLR